MIKPTFTGQSYLDKNKELSYEFEYEHMISKWVKKIDQLCMDTGSYYPIIKTWCLQRLVVMLKNGSTHQVMIEEEKGHWFWVNERGEFSKIIAKFTAITTSL